VGFGIPAFGVGPLRTAGYTLLQIYGASAVVSVTLGFAVDGRGPWTPVPAALHPRPTSHLRWRRPRPTPDHRNRHFGWRLL